MGGTGRRIEAPRQSEQKLRPIKRKKKKNYKETPKAKRAGGVAQGSSSRARVQTQVPSQKKKRKKTNK
jgi:hypothetical protein